MKNRWSWICVATALIAIAVMSPRVLRSQEMGDPLVEGFKKVAVASVSDAMDQVMHQRGFLDASMRPVVTGSVVGRAVTAYAKRATAEESTPTLAAKHAVEMIDESKPGEVGVIVMEDGLNVAAIGGLMATAAKSRDMAGMIVDGGVRDVLEIRGLGLPVYARSVSPATSVTRWATVSKNVPVDCAGVRISPGDIIVASEDGVVAVPKDKAAEVLKRAQEIDERETKMVPFIKEQKGLAKVVKMFNRI